MDDHDWEVEGIDPELRLRAIEQASASGLTLSDYLTRALQPHVHSPFHPPASSALELGLEAIKNAAWSAEEAGTVDIVHRALRDIRVAVTGLERAQDATAAKLNQRLDEISASVHVLETERQKLKQAIANDFIEFAQETQAQLDAALASGPANEERFTALMQRTSHLEAAAASNAAAVMDKVAEVESDLKKKLQALAASQQKGEAAWTAEIARLACDARGEIDCLSAAHKDLETSARDDRARVTELHEALDRVASEIAVFRSFAEQGLARSTDQQAQIQRHLTRINADWDARFDALTVRLSRAEQTVDRVEAVGSAELERIEACTVAALQKLGTDIAGVRSASAALDGEVRARVEVVADAQERVARRLAMLEAGASRAETEQALATLREKIAELAEAQATISEGENRGALDPSSSLGAHVEGLEERITRMEQRQGNALDMVRSQLAQFAADNDKRLATLESTPSSGSDMDMLAFRLARLEQRDIEAELETLGTRLDQRMLDLEARSIAALERLGDAIAELERRVTDADRVTARSA